MKYLQFEQGRPTEDILDLLQNNIIGTPGKSLVYQHMKTSEKLDFIQDPAFLSLRLGGKVVGTACFINREVSVPNQTKKATYIRYFSFRQAFRSSNDPVGRIKKSSLLKSELESFFEGQNDQIQYAYVDPGNVRSRRVIEGYGFEQVGVFRTVFMSRFYPKRSFKATIASNSELKDLLPAIKEFYKDHGLYFDHNLGYQNSYFVIKDNDRILAGIEANPEYWKVREIPGGKALINIVSRVPLINRIFNKDFRFLSLEGVYYLPGYEHLITPLVEHALHQHRRHTAIICLDPKSGVYKLFKEMDRGFIRKLTDEKEMAVMVRADNELRGEMMKMPIYVSGFDNM